MSHMYTIPEARALYASIFLQYLIWGFLYLVEGCKYIELHQQNNENLAETQLQRVAESDSKYNSEIKQSAEPEENLEGGEAEDDAGPKPAVNIEDVALEEDEDKDEEQKTESSPPKSMAMREAGSNIGLKQPDNQNPTQVLQVDPSLYRQSSQKKAQEAFTKDSELEQIHNTHFLILSVSNFQKSQLWFAVLVSLCAMRAANGFTVWMSYLILILRVVQLVAVVIKNEKMATIVYASITFLIVLMFFSEMVTEGADIVHEAEPMDDLKRDVKSFTHNYVNPYAGSGYNGGE